MSKRKNKTAVIVKELVADAKAINQKNLIAALEKLFTDEGWEIPDSAVEGKLTGRITRLEAQVKELTQRVNDTAARQGVFYGTLPGARVDAIAMVNQSKSKRKNK